MAMLIRRSVREGLLRRSGTPRQRTEVIPFPSLAASFLSSSAAAAARIRFRGSPIHSKGQCIYRMLCNRTGSTQVGDRKSIFLKMKDLAMGLVERHWTPLYTLQKVGTVNGLVVCAFLIKTFFEVDAADRKRDAADRKRDAIRASRGA